MLRRAPKRAEHAGAIVGTVGMGDSAMFATTIRYAVPDDTDWEALRQLLVRRAFEAFRDMPGLRSKAVIFAPERSEMGGNYVWDTQDHAEAYLRSDAFRAMVARFGEPRVERAEICAYVEDGDLVFPYGYEAQRTATQGPSAAAPP